MITVGHFFPVHKDFNQVLERSRWPEIFHRAPPGDMIMLQVVNKIFVVRKQYFHATKVCTTSYSDRQ